MTRKSANRSARTKITPPELANRWGISPDKILVWIHSGELRAINAATQRGGRPRYLIDERDIAVFEQRRCVEPKTRQSRRVRRSSPGVIDFFK